MKALVTGAAAGLGEAFVLSLVEKGWSVLALDRDAAGLAALAKRSSLIEVLALDLADLDTLSANIAAIANSGPFGMAIFNAGISATGRFEIMPQQILARIVAVNTIAPMQLASGLVRHGGLAAKASLVFISSLSHKTGYPGAACYAASKDAIAVYAKSIIRPFARLGIAVTTVFPGPIATAHAQRHAPQGANAGARMAPQAMAEKIIGAALRGKRVYYPGLSAKLVALAGTLVPNLATQAMRRLIFEKLARDVW